MSLVLVNPSTHQRLPCTHPFLLSPTPAAFPSLLSYHMYSTIPPIIYLTELWASKLPYAFHNLSFLSCSSSLLLEFLCTSVPSLLKYKQSYCMWLTEHLRLTHCWSCELWRARKMPYKFLLPVLNGFDQCWWNSQPNLQAYNAE